MSASVLPVLVHPALAAEGERHLPMPAEAYGLIALGIFLVLLGVLWSFRGTAYKVRDKHSRPGGGHH